MATMNKAALMRIKQDPAKLAELKKSLAARAKAQRQPLLSQRTEGPYIMTELRIPTENNQWITITNRTDTRKIARALQSQPEVAGLLGDIWGGIKKGISTVAKVTGADKVLKAASTIVKNPIIQTIVPGASLVSKGVDVARHLVVAKAAADKGDPRAKGLIQDAARIAESHPIPAVRQTYQQAINNAERVFQVKITAL